MQVPPKKPSRSRSPKSPKRSPRLQKAPELAIEVKYEEEKFEAEKSNTTTELDAFPNDLYDDDDLLFQSKFLAAFRVNTPLEETDRLFFASAVKTIGANKDVYFMESCMIGIGCPEPALPGLDLSLDPACTSQPLSSSPKLSELSMCHPLNHPPIGDYSLFGNDSDGSISGLGSDEPEDPLPCDPTGTKRTILRTVENGPSALCSLNGPELTCESNPKVTVFCIRFEEEMGPKVIFSSEKEKKMDTGKVKVREDDLLVLATASGDSNNNLNKEEIIELIKRITKGRVPRTVQPRKLANEVATKVYTKNRDQKEVSITAIAAWISRNI